MKKITINLTNDEMALLEKALKKSGLRTKTELIRHLISIYKGTKPSA
jgi:hypothetical protein